MYLFVKFLNILLPEAVQLFEVDICAALNLVRQDLHIEEYLDALNQALAVFVVEGLLKLC